MNITKLVDIDHLKEEIDLGYVSRKHHPEFPYAILNYTNRAQFENRWNDTVRICRGLIYDTADGEVIARGMTKFFNHGQPGAAQFSLDEEVWVSDKADGSLGILYPHPDGQGWSVATRGSFTSDQAVKATQMLQDAILSRGLDMGDATCGGVFSVLAEIIYPDNRIVLDYGDTEELRLLGFVSLATGSWSPALGNETDWPWSTARLLGVTGYAEALAVPPRPNAEGLVITATGDPTKMVKIKQEDYLRLHRIIFGLSARSLWKMCVDGQDVLAYIAALPDEFQDWATQTVERIWQECDNRESRAYTNYHQIVGRLDADHGVSQWSRKDFAVGVNKSGVGDTWAMFKLLDGKDITHEIMKRADPGGNITPVPERGEDVA